MLILDPADYEMEPSEALRRLREIAPRLAMETRGALERRAVMEMGNAIVGAPNVSIGVDAFNILQTTLVRSLAIDVSAAFDWSARPLPLRRQDKSSIPALVHHLRVEGVVELLVDAARRWNGLHPDQSEADCRDAVARLHQRYAECKANAEFGARLEKIVELRNSRLAHNLFLAEPPVPTYDELFSVLDVARAFADDGLLSVVGRQEDFDGRERAVRHSARDLWTRAIQHGRLASVDGSRAEAGR